MSFASRLRPHWPLIATAVSGAMLAAAHFYFERYLHLPPCPLCLDQREWHWAVVAGGIAGFVLLRFKPSWARGVAIALGIVFLLSFASWPIPGVKAWPAGGAYHIAVEQRWVTAQCDVGEVDLGDLTFDVNEELETPQCDQIAWQRFGISLAGYNAIISLVMALMSFALAFLPERKT